MALLITRSTVFWGVVCASLSFWLGQLLLFRRPDAFVTSEEEDDGGASDSSSDGDSIGDKEEEWASSVWCRGDSRSTRFCRFRNLCYQPNIDEYLFFHGPETVMAGLPARDPSSDFYVADLTSVDELNVHYLSWSDLPREAADRVSVRFYSGVTLLAKRFKPDNLMHVIHDDLLPLFATLLEYCAGVDPTCFSRVRLALLDGLEQGPFAGLYRLLGRPSVLWSERLTGATVHCFREALVGLHKETTWYEYGYQTPQRPTERRPSGGTIAHFTRHLLGRLGWERGDCGRRPPYAVFLSRASNRLVLNEWQVMRAVVEETSLKLIRVTDGGRVSVEETLKTVACADLLVGMHGAALVLALFMAPGKMLLEMFPYAVPASDYVPYRTLAGIPGVDLVYAAWENAFEENTVTHPDNVPELGGLGHLQEAERRRVQNSRRVKKHLCCGDPEWLFRIYQDTFVDEASFRRVLRDLRERQVQETRHWPSPKPDLHPGPVRDASCHRLSEKQYSVSWRAPWNLQFLPSRDDARYEMWIQRIGSDDLRSVVTTSTRYVVQLQRVGDAYNCWIRCVTNGKAGNKRWLTCR